jgi:6-pyruvoyltetrahydropterin/6-carboxytetrahydropterin synthase
MVYVKRKEHFNAAHKLYREDWSDEKNEEVFGPCANTHYHGHNFDLIVTVAGEPDPETGFVVDMKKLGVLIRSEIIDTVDHKNLNLDVPYLQGILPSCENVVKAFWNILAPKIEEIAPHARLHQIRLYETRNNFVDYFGG